MMQIMAGWANRIPAFFFGRLSRLEASQASTPATRTNTGSSFGTFPTANPAQSAVDPRATHALYNAGI